MRIAVVIPALNEQRSIGPLVERVNAIAQALVVNDGSSDATAAAAGAAGAIVVSHERNKGYDSALETGMQRALALGFDGAVTMDADGQHDPSTLRSFIEELGKGTDLVVGIRNHKQRIAESIFGWISAVLWHIDDPLCGMKGYQLSLLSRATHFDTYGSIGTELAVRAARSGCSVAQIPVRTLPREGTSRFGRGWLPNYRIIRSLILALFFASKLE